MQKSDNQLPNSQPLAAKNTAPANQQASVLSEVITPLSQLRGSDVTRPTNIEDQDTPEMPGSETNLSATFIMPNNRAMLGKENHLPVQMKLPSTPLCETVFIPMEGM